MEGKQLFLSELFIKERSFRGYALALVIWDTTLWTLMTVVPLFLSQRYGLGKEFVYSVAMGLLPSIVLSPIVGAWVDRWGAKRVTILYIFMYCLFVFYLPFTSELWEVQMIMFCMGVAKTVGSPASLTLRTLVIPSGNEIQGNSIVMGIDRIAKIIGPLIGSLFAVLFSLHWILIICSVVGIIPFVMFANLKFNYDPIVESQNKKFWNAVWTAFPKWLQLLNRDQIVLGLVISGMGYTVTLGMLKIYLMSYANLFGDMDTYWGFFLSTQGFGALVGTMLCPILLSRWAKKFSLTIIYTFFVIMEVLFLAGFSIKIHLFYSLTILCFAAIFEAVATIIYFSVIQIRVPSGKQGSFNGFTIPAMDTSYTIGFMLSGFLINILTMQEMLWICLLFTIVTLLPFLSVFYQNRDGLRDSDL